MPCLYIAFQGIFSAAIAGAKISVYWLMAHSQVNII
jgi:hypothetical protein